MHMDACHNSHHRFGGRSSKQNQRTGTKPLVSMHRHPGVEAANHVVSSPRGAKLPNHSVAVVGVDPVPTKAQHFEAIVGRWWIWRWWRLRQVRFEGPLKIWFWRVRNIGVNPFPYLREVFRRWVVDFEMTGDLLRFTLQEF